MTREPPLHFTTEYEDAMADNYIEERELRHFEEEQERKARVLAAFRARLASAPVRTARELAETIVGVGEDLSREERLVKKLDAYALAAFLMGVGFGGLMVLALGRLT